MKITYKTKRFNHASLMVIIQANKIINEYQEAGLTLTLRQLYYQFVSRDLMANTTKDYGRLGRIVNDGRLAGMISWKAIEDRTRNVKTYYHNTDPGDAVEDALRHFSLNKWNDQDFYIEVWIEKEALTGVIANICYNLDIPYLACKGYVSQSEMWAAAHNRFEQKEAQGKETVLIHLGDHDPSGMDMTRDIKDRQSLFMGCTSIERIALNMNQIDKYNPPPNPAKMSDSRSADYVQEFGSSSWELDALEPRVMQKLIKDKVLEYRDETVYQKTKKLENEYREILENVVENWEHI